MQQRHALEMWQLCFECHALQQHLESLYKCSDMVTGIVPNATWRANLHTSESSQRTSHAESQYDMRQPAARALL